MKEIQLFLIPAPGAKPEFLAKIRPVSDTPHVDVWNAAPSTVTLEGYTRDSWAWKPNTTGFITLTTESTDGRKKLPGFVKYLRERQKSCYGRFSPTGLWVISYVQPSKNNEDQLECRITMDLSTIPNCKLQPKQKAALAPSAKPQQQPTKPTNTTSSTTTIKRKTGGLLGQLIGAQQRTNRHVAKARQPAAAAAAATRTAQDVFLAFREQCNQTMLDFDLATDEDVKKISITLQEQQVGLSNEEKPKVTMEVLKYMVYEAAEDVNEEWIAYKEPTDFVDECVVAVYKEGAAPPEVLEDVNKGDLPDEAIGQQRAIAEQRERQELAKAAKQNNMMEQQAHLELNEDEDDLAALNTNKRDRRTVEDFERERKRGKS